MSNSIIKLQTQLFQGENKFRPQPEIHVDQTDHFVIVLTPWGQRTLAKEAMTTMVDYVRSSKTDGEITTPFARLSNLSSTANNLRNAALMANDVIYQRHNKQEYQLGLELFLGAFQSSLFVWVQIGQPHVLLLRKGQTPLVMSSSLDLSGEFGAEQLPPLPSEMFGLDPAPNLTVKSFRPMPGDKVLLLNRSWLSAELFKDATELENLDSLGHRLIHQSNTPFWSGLLEFGNSVSNE